MKKAYSYVRFSSPEQISGDSLRRQTSLAEDYAAEFELQLDNELTYRDLGVSSFRSQNATSGRLGAFLAAVYSGTVPTGSILLVENLDRLSRDNAVVAQNLLTQIVMAGISVVTLSDRREYSMAELKRDPMGLLFALINFIRANEESELKSVRIRAAWTAKRAVIGGAPLTAQCPAWMRLDPVTKTFVLNAQRVRVIRKIYSWAAGGMSLSGIADRLTKTKTPLWERQPAWTSDGVSRLLAHVAVVGTFTPRQNIWREGKAIRIPCAPIRNYFPVIIAPDLFRRAQVARMQSGRGERGQQINIVNRLAQCVDCGAPMARTHYGANAAQVLVCSAAKAGLGCVYEEVTYAPIEIAVRAHIASLLLDADLSSTKEGRTPRIIRARNGLDRARRRVSHLRSCPPAGGQPAEAAVYQNWREELYDLECALVDAEAQMLEVVESWEPQLGKAVEAKVAHALECIASPNGSATDVMAFNRALRAVFVKAEVHVDQSRIGLWRNNGDVVWIAMG